MSRNKIMSGAKKSLKYFAIGSLVTAYILGYFMREKDQIRQLQAFFPNEQIERRVLTQPDIKFLMRATLMNLKQLF